MTKKQSVLVLLFKVLVFYQGRDLLSSTQNVEIFKCMNIESKKRWPVCWLAAFEELVIDGHW